MKLIFNKRFNLMVLTDKHRLDHTVKEFNEYRIHKHMTKKSVEYLFKVSRYEFMLFIYFLTDIVIIFNILVYFIKEYFLAKHVNCIFWKLNI